MASSDIEAPVGYDAFGYSYRDLEGSKVHAGWRHPYGEAYGEGDTVGMYINLPDGAQDAPKPPEVVKWKGQPYFVEETTGEKPVPGGWGLGAGGRRTFVCMRDMLIRERLRCGCWRFVLCDVTSANMM